jgi:hypothetical protein
MIFPARDLRAPLHLIRWQGCNISCDPITWDMGRKRCPTLQHVVTKVSGFTKKPPPPPTLLVILTSSGWLELEAATSSESVGILTQPRRPRLESSPSWEHHISHHNVFVSLFSDRPSSRWISFFWLQSFRPTYPYSNSPHCTLKSQKDTFISICPHARVCWVQVHPNGQL